MADVVSLFGDNCINNEAHIDINGVIDGLVNDRDELQEILIVGINKDGELDIRSSLGFTESYFLAYRAKQFFLKYKLVILMENNNLQQFTMTNGEKFTIEGMTKTTWRKLTKAK